MLHESQLPPLSSVQVYDILSSGSENRQKGSITMQMSEVISSAYRPAVRQPDSVSPNRALFDRQKLILDTFLSHGAITPAQYNKSLSDMQEKMLIK